MVVGGLGMKIAASEPETGEFYAGNSLLAGAFRRSATLRASPALAIG